MKLLLLFMMLFSPHILYNIKINSWIIGREHVIYLSNTLYDITMLQPFTKGENLLRFLF